MSAPKRTRTSTRLSRTRPSTWRVYQFRHRREGSRSIAAGPGAVRSRRERAASSSPSGSSRYSSRCPGATARRRDDRARDQHVARADGLAERREVGREVRERRRPGSPTSVERVRRRTGRSSPSTIAPRRSPSATSATRRPEHHVAVEDVAGEDLLDLELALAESTSSIATPSPPIAAATASRSPSGRHVARDVDRDLRLGRRLRPVADRHVAAGLAQAAVGEVADERRARPVLLHRGGGPEPQLPADRARALAEQPAARLELALHPAAHARVVVQVRSCAADHGVPCIRPTPELPSEHMFDRPEEPQAAWTSART